MKLRFNRLHLDLAKLDPSKKKCLGRPRKMVALHTPGLKVAGKPNDGYIAMLKQIKWKLTHYCLIHRYTRTRKCSPSKDGRFLDVSDIFLAAFAVVDSAGPRSRPPPSRRWA